MRYKESVVEVIRIEREQGKTYKEISEKLKISIYHVKKALYDRGEAKKPRRTKESGKTRKDKKSNMDSRQTYRQESRTI
mgnify:CR=1 FL=1